MAPAEIAERGRDLPTLSEFKEYAEREFLVAKLRENGWNISRTAEVIQTPRSNLYKKIEHHKIAREEDAQGTGSFSSGLRHSAKRPDRIFPGRTSKRPERCSPATSASPRDSTRTGISSARAF